MKKMCVLFLAVLMLCTLSSCDRKKKDYNIAVLVPGEGNYFIAVKNGANLSARENGVRLLYSDAEWNTTKQLKQIYYAIDKKVDMIAICSVDAQMIIPGIQAAYKAGIPVLAFTNALGLDESGTIDEIVSYVGQNEVETGKLCAEMAKELLNGEKGRVLSIEGRSGTFCQIYRREGFIRGIEGCDIEIVYTRTGDWDREKAMKEVQNLLKENADFNFVFCHDDSMAAGVGKVLSEAGLKDKIKIIGIGGSIDGIQALKDGVIDGNTFLSAEEEGYKAIEICVKYLNGEKIDKHTVISQREITKENIDEFQGEW